MQANWNLIFNVLLLVGVIVAIGRLMKARRQNLNEGRYVPSGASHSGQGHFQDDIIAVRKVNFETEADVDEPLPSLSPNPGQETTLRVLPEEAAALCDNRSEEPAHDEIEDNGPTLMLFLLAKENRQFAGYELLQTVLSAGLRFGEGNVFHRHLFSNGDGPILCSLAAATASGVFDLQNIGAFTVRGLCLYMNASNHAKTNEERLAVMFDVAKQLAEGLDAHLLDDQRKPLTDESMASYCERLGLPEVA